LNKIKKLNTDKA
jgi:hypothetical protein